MEITGKITAKPAPKEGVSQRGPWKKVFIVVEYESGQYPKSLLLHNMDKAEDFDKLKVGDTGTFKFDGNVRESNGQYYLDLKCWSWKLNQSEQEPF